MTATVVLVHGAWHGAWCWDRVIAGLDARGIPAVAPDLPGHGSSSASLGDLAGDAAALRAVLDGLEGPLVVCGHSYGGAVVTEGAAGHAGTRHLVFLAAAALRPGESCSRAAVDETAGIDVTTELDRAIVREGDVLGLDPTVAADAFFHDCHPDDAAAATARLERQAVGSLTGRVTVAAWEDIPSTYVVCAGDRVVSPTLQRILARRVQTTIELPTGHSPSLSHPDLVVNVLAAAVADAADSA